MSSPLVDKNRGSVSESFSRKKKDEDYVKGKRRSLKLDTQNSPQHKIEEVTNSKTSNHKEGENREEEENMDVGDFSSNLEGYPSSREKSEQDEEGENSENFTIMGNADEEGN